MGLFAGGPLRFGTLPRSNHFRWASEHVQSEVDRQNLARFLSVWLSIIYTCRCFVRDALPLPLELLADEAAPSHTARSCSRLRRRTDFVRLQPAMASRHTRSCGSLSGEEPSCVEWKNSTTGCPAVKTYHAVGCYSAVRFGLAVGPITTYES